MASQDDLTFPSGIELRPVPMVDGIPVNEGRNARQLAQIAARLNSAGLIDVATGQPPGPTNGPRMSIDEKFRCYATTNLPRPHLYLFNIIVATEWTPSAATIEVLRNTAVAASAFLYDVSNGAMAIGQMIVGGRRYLPMADIQIMASTRFHPRSWVDGLNNPAKYTPIRLGRGIWSKHSRVVIPWEEPEGHRTIIHEWAHYALNLVDEYLDYFTWCRIRAPRRLDVVPFPSPPPIPAGVITTASGTPAGADVPLVVPKISLPLESIMASLEASEIVPQQHRQDPASRQRLLGRMANYPGVDLTVGSDVGPADMPCDLPPLVYTFAPIDDVPEHDERRYAVDALRQNLTAFDRDHCWLYLLRLASMGPSPVLQRVMAQGTIDARAWPLGPQDQAEQFVQTDAGFPLLGAQVGDHLLAIGWGSTTSTTSDSLLVGQGVLAGAAADYLEAPGMRLASPPEAPPLVSVIPAPPEDPAQPWMNFPVWVRIVGPTRPDTVWIVPPGQAPVNVPIIGSGVQIGVNRWRWETDVVTSDHLDGLVVLHWDQRPDPFFWVADYSHGGGPPTNVYSPMAPISAGSSDGNLLLFFRKVLSEQDDYTHLRVVTTRNFAGADPAPGEPRSYLYSVAANEPLPDEIAPTAVFFFDRDTVVEGGDLEVRRYDDASGTWTVIPAYVPGGRFAAAISLYPPLGGNAAGGATWVEHYQLFQVPQGSSASSLPSVSYSA